MPDVADRKRVVVTATTGVIVAMMTASRRSRRLLVLALLTGLAFLVGSIAWATGSSEGVIRACVVPSSGTLRVIQDGESCRRNARLLEWNVQGVQGIQGTQGEKGEKGEKGDPGAAGVSGYQIVKVPVSFKELYGLGARAVQVQVTCPAGQVVFGLGGNGMFFNGGNFVIRASVADTNVVSPVPGVNVGLVSLSKYDGGLFAVNDELTGEAWATCATVGS
jgi:hypothetical protein